MKKVLIGIGTCTDYEYIEKHCIPKILAQTFKDFDILLVDNSEEPLHAMQLMKDFPQVKIEHIKRPVFFRDACKEVRQYIVDHAVYNCYEYLFFVDIDFLLEPDTLEKLMSHNVDFVTAPIGYMHRPETTCFLQNFEEKRCSQTPHLPPLKGLTWEEIKKAPDFMEIIACGLSCALLKCIHLPGIKFKVTHETTAFFEDLWFCADLIKQGVKIHMDSTINTIHAHVKIIERGWRELNPSL